LGKEATKRTETINDTVRGTQVEVERVEGKKASQRESTTQTKPV
jgi:hypothetical protein